MASLKLAAQGENRHARAANQMITAIDTPAQALEEALRKAVHTLSAPAADSKPPEAKPPEPPPAPADAGTTP